MNLTEGPYLRDLLEQPHALRRTWEQLPEASRFLRIAQTLADGKYRRVVLTGMGSSLFALTPLYLALIERGIDAHLLETSELIHYMRGCLTHDSLVIAVSQSGRSVEMVMLLDLVRGVAPLLAVTNDASSPLAHAGGAATMLIQAGPESTVSCKTYVCTLMALEWLTAILTGQDLTEVRDDLQGASGAVAEYIAGLRQHATDLRELVDGVKHVFVVGRGRSVAAARTGGLILKESTRFAAEGMSSAAFRHGPFEVLRPEVFVAVLQGDERGEVLNRRLVADVKAAGGRAELIGTHDAVRPFLLPAAPRRVLEILEVLPVQMLTLALAAMQGREPGRFEIATKVTDVE